MRYKEMFNSVDAHVAGQPLRLITFGVPRLEPAPLREQIEEMRSKYDHIRNWLLAEPRGHAGMTGALLVPSIDPDIDYGVIFMSAGGYKPLSGHGMIALATILIDTGVVPIDGPDTRIDFETFSGPIQARASVDQGRVRGVRFRNVPSFRLRHELPIEVYGSTMYVDVAYGGNWYAIAKAKDLGVDLDRDHALAIKQAGLAVAREVAKATTVDHPLDPALGGLFGTVLLGDPRSDESTSRNATVYLDGLIDRSPCGTGMAATMACMAADGDLDVGHPFVAESILDTTMTGRIVGSTQVGDREGIVTEITGKGQVTGSHQFFVDPTDPVSAGFILL